MKNNNCNTILVVEAKENLSSELASLKSCNELRELTIQIADNKGGWVVFSRINGVSDNQATFSHKKSIKTIPEETCDLTQLTSLDVSYLGIESLPFNLSKLSNLTLLNISFNKIVINKEIDLLTSLQNLKILKIYGCLFSDEDILKVRKLRPDIKILFEEKHLIQEMKERSAVSDKN